MATAELSQTLAKIIGLYCLILAMSALLNRQNLTNVLNELMDSEGLMYLSSLMALIIGLVLITIHNVIALDYRALITIFGWASFIKGVVHLLIPELAYNLNRSVLHFQKTYSLIMLVVLCASLWLLKEGFAINI